MRVLFLTCQPPHHMAPPVLSTDQVNCGPCFTDEEVAGRWTSRRTPYGAFDVAALASRIPPDQEPDVVVCHVDCGFGLKPQNLAAFRCPKVLLAADSHWGAHGVTNMVQYARSEPFDRVVILYDRHHLEFYREAGIQRVHWFPGLTFAHSDARVAAAEGLPREAQLALVGKAGYHFRRQRLFAALLNARLPLAWKQLQQSEAIRFYGQSLIGLNVSMNGDLNLRVFETIAGGAMLLTDRLVPTSGLDELLPEGVAKVSYATESELLEKARYYLHHPDEARLIGQAGQDWFSRYFNEQRRQAAFADLVFNGRDLPEFEVKPRPRSVGFGQGSMRIDGLLAAYDHVNELHRQQETVTVLAATDLKPELVELFQTLPRVRVERAIDGADQPRVDLVITDRVRLQRNPALNGNALWCLDAAPGDGAELPGQLSGRGLIVPIANLPFYVRRAAPPAPGHALALKARQHLEVGDLQNALKAAQESVAANPQAVEGKLVLAELALEAGNVALAEKVLAALRAADPTEPRITLLQHDARKEPVVTRQARLLQSAWRAYEAYNDAAAERLAGGILKAGADSGLAWYILGLIYRRARRGETNQDAARRWNVRELEALNRAADLLPGSAGTCLALGVAAKDAGRLDAAEKAFNRYVELEPADAVGWSHLIDCAVLRRDATAVAAALHRARQRVPSHPLWDRFESQNINAPSPRLDQFQAAFSRRTSGQRFVHRTLLPLADRSLADFSRAVGEAVDLDTPARLAALLAAHEIAARNGGEQAPPRAALLAFQPWFGFNYRRLLQLADAAGTAVILVDDNVDLPLPSLALSPAQVRTFVHRGISLWSVCHYRLAQQLRTSPDWADFTAPATLALAQATFAHAAALIERIESFVQHYRPECLIYAQGYDLIAAVMRQVGIRHGLRVVAIENTFNKSRLLWEDLSGIAVNKNAAKNYFWRYRDTVPPEAVEATRTTYLSSIKSLKSAEHASPAELALPLPTNIEGKTLLYLGQVGIDSSILYGLRQFPSQAAIIARVARYAASNNCTLLIKLHPKECVTYVDEAAMLYRNLTLNALQQLPEFRDAEAALGSRLVLDSTNQLDTYALVQRADVCVTINSQAGLEAALFGREVILCGEAFYGSLGFTHEAQTLPDLDRCLDSTVRDCVRLNDGSKAAVFFHIYSELYCLPKTEASLVELALGRPSLPPPTGRKPEGSSTMAAAPADQAHADDGLVDPTTLVVPSRLDLVVKYQYFNALIRGGDRAACEALYRDHIMCRTGGQEPADATTGRPSNKRRVDDYIEACAALAQSMQGGFLREHAIPVSADGLIANGAHRVACALATRMRVATTPSTSAGPAWDFAWFQEHGFKPEVLSRLLHGWCQLRADRSSIFVLWPTVAKQWEQIEAEIARNFDIVGSHDLNFESAEVFASVVYDIYSHRQESAEMPHIDRKLDLFRGAPRSLRIVVGYNRSSAESTADLADRTKRHIRLLFDAVAPKDRFITCHASDSPEELRYLADVLLDPNNVRWFRYRVAAAARPDFLKWIAIFKREARRRGFPVEACCVVGSSSLELLGIRASTDLDFTLTSTWRKQLFDAGITHLADHVDVVTEGYHRVPPPRTRISDDELITDPRHHFWYRGVKFAAPQVIRDRKDFSRRPKDVVDVDLIDRFLGNLAVRPAPVDAAA